MKKSLCLLIVLLGGCANQNGGPLFPVQPFEPVVFTPMQIVTPPTPSNSTTFCSQTSPGQVVCMTQ